MQSQDSPFFIFDTHTQAEEAVQSLKRSDFDEKKLSLIGKGWHSDVPGLPIAPWSHLPCPSRTTHSSTSCWPLTARTKPRSRR
jgi:hypothetical protein